MNEKEKICKGCGEKYIPRHDKDHRCAECYKKQGSRISRRGKANEDAFARGIERVFNERFGKELYRVRRTPSSGAFHLDFPADIFYPKAPDRSILRDLHIDTKVADTWSPERWWSEEKELCQKTGFYFKKVLIVMRRPRESENYVFMRWSDFEKMLLETESYRNEEKNI